MHLFFMYLKKKIIQEYDMYPVCFAYVWLLKVWSWLYYSHFNWKMKLILKYIANLHRWRDIWIMQKESQALEEERQNSESGGSLRAY